jgi:hypothetical protein
MAKIGTRNLKIEIDAVDYTASVSNARITSAEGDTDFVTFADAAAGGSRAYKLAFTAAQDADSASLWTKVFDSSGTTVPITIMPYGNAIATAAEPHFTATAVISEPDGDFLGGEANASTTARFTFDCEWDLEAKPARVSA